VTDEQTDGQTEGQMDRVAVSVLRVSVLTRDKNPKVCVVLLCQLNTDSYCDTFQYRSLPH